MSSQNFSDLHCHPALHPLMLERKSIWNTHLGKSRKKIKRHQKKGKRGGLYDQAGYPKLINSRVKLVYASLYSLEQGFMMNNSLLLSGINIFLKIRLIFPFLLQIVGINLHIRDFLMSLYTKYKVRRLRVLKKQEYWVEFKNEFDHYKRLNNGLGKLSNDSIDEIKYLLNYAYGSSAKNVNTSGVFKVADGNWDKNLPPGDDVLTVLTMEGLAIVSQTKRGGGNSKHGTRLLTENTIAERFEYLKKQVPIFFVTFSHHFSSELCGHARSVPNKTRFLGLLNQEYFINQGFSRLGYKSLLYLLSLKRVGGRLVKDETAGRRIFIDVKHLSLRGRLTLYQLAQNYNSANPDEKIPVIASHIGYSNRTIGEMLQAIKSKKEKDKTQCETVIIHGREHQFNTWSINLGKEEVGIIVKTGGLIGISLEQNNLGVPFGKKTKRKPYEYFAKLVMNQMLTMAKASASKDFWDCVTMGTDFDGLIDPVDKYSSTLFFEKLRSDLKSQLEAISNEEKKEAYLDQFDLDVLLNKVFIDNAFKFLQRHFDIKNMPKL